MSTSNAQTAAKLEAFGKVFATAMALVSNVQLFLQAVPFGACLFHFTRSQEKRLWCQTVLAQFVAHGPSWVHHGSLASPDSHYLFMMSMSMVMFNAKVMLHANEHTTIGVTWCYPPRPPAFATF